LIIFTLVGGGIFWHFFKNSKKSAREFSQLKLNLPKTMKLTSPAFESNQFIPSKYTCDGEDVSPPLNISQVPERAKSLVLIIDDSDAPAGSWDHWIVWNIKASISRIEENKTPKGAVEGLNDFKKHSYGGPCPPGGIHHYHFKLYALSRDLSIDNSSKKEDVIKAINGLILDKAELVGLYQRK